MDKDITIERQSDDKVVNAQGITMLRLLEGYGMAVMNGVGGGSSGKATCRDRSVVDWIAVKRDMVQEVSPMVVDKEWMEEGGRRDGDHRLVRMEWNRVGVNNVAEEVSGAVEGSDKRTDRRPRLRKGRRNKWKSLVKSADEVMKVWCDTRQEGAVEEQVRGWTVAYEETVTKGLGWVVKGTGGPRPGWYKDIEQVKEEVRQTQREWMRANEDERKGLIGEKRKEVRRKRQRMLREKRHRVKSARMKRIEEEAKKGDRGGLVRALEAGSSRKRAPMGGVSARAGRATEWGPRRVGCCMAVAAAQVLCVAVEQVGEFGRSS